MKYHAWRGKFILTGWYDDESDYFVVAEGDGTRVFWNRNDAEMFYDVEFVGAP